MLETITVWLACAISCPWIAAQHLIGIVPFTQSTLVAKLPWMEGPHVDAPSFIVWGPRYYSGKWSVPFTDETSVWSYGGDEVGRPDAAGYPTVDEDTLAFRVGDDFGQAWGLRGDESYPECRGGHSY